MSQPPYYILFSHSAGAQPATLGHPNIHYHYANDDPSVLWPQHPNEHVLVLDYPQSDKGTPTVQSLSKDLVVVSLKVEEAPAAAAATGDNELRNNNMYIIETTTSDGRVEGPTERKPAYDVVAQFKRRNAIIRRALLYPDDCTTQTTRNAPDVSSPQHLSSTPP